MPRFPFPFEPIRGRLYTPLELLAGFDPQRPESYSETLDFKIYRQYITAGRSAPSDFFPAMMQAMHDNSISLATHEHLESASARAVGIMGGHDLARSSASYRNVAHLARELATRGFTLLSGGGPGAMEATHLGALLQAGSAEDLNEVLAELATQPSLPPGLDGIVGPAGLVDLALAVAAHAWLVPAYRLLEQVKAPGASVAIPTWLYGHEPTSPFATHIAKYFQNSVREDGLLAVATHGVIYSEGRAGTLQEVFQDANQNYYRLYGTFSPMTFYGVRYWTTEVPVIPLLRALFKPEDFESYVLVTDDPAEIVEFLAGHPQPESPAERLNRFLKKNNP